jgi:hypothetical protein
MGGVLADHHGLLGQNKKGLGAGAETHCSSDDTKPGPKVWALFVSALCERNVAFWPISLFGGIAPNRSLSERTGR